MRSCFSSADCSEHWFTFAAFWGFHVHAELLLHPWAAETLHREVGWTGWVASLSTNRNISKRILKYSKHFFLFQMTKIISHNTLFALMCVTWYSFPPLVVSLCLRGNGRENVLWQEDESSNRLRAENLTLITEDSSEERRVRGRETQSQPRKKRL